MEEFKNQSLIEFCRQDLGVWIGFEGNYQQHKVLIAAPQHMLDDAGCSVFFNTSVDETVATDIAREITKTHNLKNSQWMTTTGIELIPG